MDSVCDGLYSAQQLGLYRVYRCGRFTREKRPSLAPSEAAFRQDQAILKSRAQERLKSKIADFEAAQGPQMHNSKIWMIYIKNMKMEAINVAERKRQTVRCSKREQTWKEVPKPFRENPAEYVVLRSAKDKWYLLRRDCHVCGIQEVSNWSPEKYVISLSAWKIQRQESNDTYWHWSIRTVLQSATLFFSSQRFVMLHSMSSGRCSYKNRLIADDIKKCRHVLFVPLGRRFTRYGTSASFNWFENEYISYFAPLHKFFNLFKD